MGIKTHDFVEISGKVRLEYDDGSNLFSIKVADQTVWQASSSALVGMTRGTLAATGSGASTAAVITKQVTAVTASDGTKAVALPAATDTLGPLLVINTVDSALLPVYPVNGGNDNINAGAEDAAFNLGPGQAAWFIPTSATQWYVAPVAAMLPALAELNILDGLTTTTAELNKLDDSLASNLLTRGAGVDTAESYAAGIFRTGSLIITRIVVDISTLVGSATDLDIIGESAAVDCHWGQITAAKSGTLIGGQVTCLEVPAGGSADLDFYSSNIGTGTQDVIITDAALGTETALVTSGGAWTSGLSKGMTALPTANDYLYIVNGAASGGTFTAGKFLIELYGLGA